MFSDNFKFDQHIDAITKKANQQLGIIARVFKNKNIQTFVPLCKTFVRPFLEYNSVIWSPYTCTKQNEKKIENFQKKMCKMISDLRSLPYEENLRRTKLLTLRARSIKHQPVGLLIFKIKNKSIDLRFIDFLRHHRTRGNIFKLMIPKSCQKCFC